MFVPVYYVSRFVLDRNFLWIMSCGVTGAHVGAALVETPSGCLADSTELSAQFPALEEMEMKKQKKTISFLEIGGY